MAMADMLNVCGVEVDFPFTPYPCQLVYMEKVIESLQRVRNARRLYCVHAGTWLCFLYFDPAVPLVHEHNTIDTPLLMHLCSNLEKHPITLSTYIYSLS